MLLLTLLLSTLSISHALPIPPETGIQVTENLNPQPLQILFDLVNVEEDNSDDARDESSSTQYYTCSSGTSTPSEYQSSDFTSMSDDVSDQKVVQEQLAEGIRIFVPGLDR